MSQNLDGWVPTPPQWISTTLLQLLDNPLHALPPTPSLAIYFRQPFVLLCPSNGYVYGCQMNGHHTREPYFQCPMSSMPPYESIVSPRPNSPNESHHSYATLAGCAVLAGIGATMFAFVITSNAIAFAQPNEGPVGSRYATHLVRCGSACLLRPSCACCVLLGRCEPTCGYCASDFSVRFDMYFGQFCCNGAQIAGRAGTRGGWLMMQSVGLMHNSGTQMCFWDLRVVRMGTMSGFGITESRQILAAFEELQSQQLYRRL